MSEVWVRVPISPYRNYEVSDLGNVRRGERNLKGYVDRYGYRTVLLSYAGLSKRFKVHRLVCEAFHGPSPVGHEACHGDGVRSNNSANNLRWGSRGDNVRDAVRHGTHKYKKPPLEAMRRGEGNPQAKLTAEIVMRARQMFASGLSGAKIAKIFGVTQANMSRAIRGAAWAHVPNGDLPTLPHDRKDSKKGVSRG